MHHRIENIEQRAVELLYQANAMSAPVDPLKVANALGVRVHYQTFEDEVSGVLLIQDKDRHILVNKSHHPNRQRFSIAHELGHLVLHDQKGNRLFIDTHLRLYQRVGAPNSAAYSEPGSATTPQEEREANQFAAALLMPRPLLETATFERDLWDEIDISTLATNFAVSEQAMAIRLQQLSVVNAVLMTDM